MNAEFYQGNRQRLYDSLPDHTLLLLFSGSSIRKTADENYPFYADRSFLYLTGIGQEHTVLMAEKDGEEVQETLYILPPDMLAERWTGKRFTPGGGQGAIRGRADRIERRVGKPSETSDAERTV